MRDFSKVVPTFWTGATGRAIRGDALAQAVGLYLITSPHANMLGLYHCPLAYIASDTGHPLEGASKGLRRVEEAHFCTFDYERDLVWVHEMARFQVGEELKPKDNQIVAVAKLLAALPKCQLTFAFFNRYADCFRLQGRPELIAFERAFEMGWQGVMDPLRSQEQEQEQEQFLSIEGDNLSGLGADRRPGRGLNGHLLTHGGGRA